MSEEIQLIPIASIRVVNPRVRDSRKFSKVVESIRNIGLKKPIRVAMGTGAKAGGPTYDLVCGQGRMEAFQALGYEEIPALVCEVSKEEAMLMSLIENMARRWASPIELVDEIERLKSRGHSNVSIGKKLDISDSMVGNLLLLRKAGEGRLIYEALKGTIPLGVAIDIAKVETAEQQREFLEAYESKHLNQAGIRMVRNVMMQRSAFGKRRDGGSRSGRCRSAEGLVATFKKETQRQKLLIKKTTLCESRVAFIVEAMRRLCADEDFITLLRAEKLDTMPKELSELMAATSP